jgi:hypothetical protein
MHFLVMFLGKNGNWACLNTLFNKGFPDMCVILWQSETCEPFFVLLVIDMSFIRSILSMLSIRLCAALAGMAHEEVGDKFEENTNGLAGWESAAHGGGVRGDSTHDSADQSQSEHVKPAGAGEVGSKRRRPPEQTDEMNDDSGSMDGDVE